MKLRLLVVCVLFLSVFLLVTIPAREVPASQHQEIITEPDHTEQIKCLADNIYYEARSEDNDGRMAVASVTMNRVKSDKFSSTVCGVVKQQNNNNKCQFSWWCDIKLRHQAINSTIYNKEVYEEIWAMATHIFYNHHNDNDLTNGALFYHADYVKPRWRHKLIKTVQIGRHIFYRSV